MLFELLILVIQSKKKTNTQKLVKLKKVADHDDSNKHFTTTKFNKSTAENLTARLKEVNLATKAEETGFDNELKKLNKKVTLNKTKHVETEKKLAGLTNKVVKQKYQKKNTIFCQAECILQVTMVIRIFQFLL